MTRNGIVAKKQKPPRRLDRTRQIEARTVFARRIADWHTMTDAAKTQWNAYAATHPVVNRLGHSRYITGFNWFMKLRDTDEGILLPTETAPPAVWYLIKLYEDGPYYIEITWPAEATDEWTLMLSYTEMHDFDQSTGQLNFRNICTITKADEPDNWFTLLDSLGIVFLVGHHYGFGAVLRGPRLWPSQRVLGSAQVETEALLAFHLTMNDDAATPIVTDYYGHYYQTFEGTNPNTEDHSVAGVHGNALHFDGATSKIVLTSASYHSYLAEGQPFTLAMWWKPDTPIGASYKEFISNGDAAHAYLYFGIRNTNSIINVRALWGGNLYSDNHQWAETDTGEWRHFAIVRNGTNLKLFKDGVCGHDVTAAQWQGAFFDATVPYSIGCRAGSSAFADGAADDVHLYNRALSDAEVLVLATP